MEISKGNAHEKGVINGTLGAIYQIFELRQQFAGVSGILAFQHVERFSFHISVEDNCIGRWNSSQGSLSSIFNYDDSPIIGLWLFCNSFLICFITSSRRCNINLNVLLLLLL